MNQSKSFAKLLAYLFFFGLSLLVFFGSGFGTLFAPSLGDGKLGAPSSELISKIMEVALSVVTALIGSGIFGKSKWMQMLVDVVGPFFKQSTPQATPEDQFEADMMRLLAHAISQSDRDMVIMIVDRLATKPFMVVTANPFPTAKT